MNEHQPFRIEPAGKPQDYQTYAATVPLATHYRDATCAEVDCAAHSYGWKTTVDVSTELGARQAKYITEKSGRRYTAIAEPGDYMLTFTFPAGQKCFATHRVLLEREPNFMIRQGDYRQYGRTTPMNGRDWLDSFGEHQQKLREQRERG
jgi:hypothetical protein